MLARKNSDLSLASFWFVFQCLDKKGAASALLNGGETGIRTLVTVSRKHAFQACAFSHSAISPHKTEINNFKSLTT
jgi:hypothetical protein